MNHDTQETEFYAKNQVERIFPYMEGVDWFIVGGPADGNEAQKLVYHYPKVRVIGIEPCTKFYQFQVTNCFPGKLIAAALWSECTTKLLTEMDNSRGASLVKYNDNGTGKKVVTTTLDTLDCILGPFENCGIWIDIEESEYECLLGAHKLLSEQRIKFLNVEVSNKNRSVIEELLNRYNYRMISEHDIRYLEEDRIISDVIYTRNGVSCA